MLDCFSAASQKGAVLLQIAITALFSRQDRQTDRQTLAAVRGSPHDLFAPSLAGIAQNAHRPDGPCQFCLRESFIVPTLASPTRYPLRKASSSLELVVLPSRLILLICFICSPIRTGSAWLVLQHLTDIAIFLNLALVFPNPFAPPCRNPGPPSTLDNSLSFTLPIVVARRLSACTFSSLNQRLHRPI